MLNNAIKQTCEKGIELRKESWKKVLRKEVDKLDVEKVRNDVSRFLENHSDIELLNKEKLYKILQDDKVQ